MTIEEALNFAETGCDGDSLATLSTLAAEVRRLREKHEAAIMKLREAESLPESVGPSSQERATGYVLACRKAIRFLS